MDVGAELGAVRSAATILGGLRAGHRLALAAAEADGHGSLDLLVAATADPDPLTAVASVHALGALGGPGAADQLAGLLHDGRAHVAEHAVDALGSVDPVREGLAPLVARVEAGGFVGMLAQRTLEAWANRAPDAVRGGLVAALATSEQPEPRARLVETLGLVLGDATAEALAGIAGRADEAPRVRAAASAALDDHRWAGGSAQAADPPGRSVDGLTVAQLFLHSDIDGGLQQSGRGDTGGIATLLVQLGDALLQQRPRVARVVTMSGCRADPPATPEGDPHRFRRAGHHYAGIPLWGRASGIAAAWPHRVAARRGIRRILRAVGRVDALHLRMADVGSLAAAEVARELDIPVVFTLAPDPHALVAAREEAGTLTRAGFGDADRQEHLWFRDRLLRDLADQAQHLVLFPRPDVERTIERLVGIDVTADPDRVRVIGEGVDLVALGAVAREGRHGAARGNATTAALADLDTLLAPLPPRRRALPLLVSVARLAPVKGVATLAGAWLDDPTLRGRCNLLVVGGDLEDPTAEEEAELSRIRSLVAADDTGGEGLVLAGHRPHATTTAWLVAAQQGRPGVAAPRGAYVCASLKEEFGIAILEAMAAGLVVVAPASGGPATYVTDGDTGILTDTSSPEALADAAGRALDLASAPGSELRARRARALVRDRFGIGTMAAALAQVYAAVGSRDALGAAGNGPGAP